MLYFKDDEVKAALEKKTCRLCGERVGVWMATLLDGNNANACGHCLLYSGMAQWGHDNREELLHVGRAAQETAVKHNRPIPYIDERGRLEPSDAEKFVMGVSFTSRMVVDRFGLSSGTE